MAKHKNRSHDEPDDEPTEGLAAFDSAIPAPPDEPDPFAPEAPAAVGSHPASPNPAAGAVPPKPAKAVAMRKATVTMRKATVTMPGGQPVEVEYPADTPDDARPAAAKKAYMDAVGQWALPAEPHIDLH